MRQKVWGDALIEVPLPGSAEESCAVGRGRAIPKNPNSVRKLLEHAPEKLIDFSDILDIGYIRCLIEDMLQFFDGEPVCPITWNRISSTSEISDVSKTRFHVIGIGSNAWLSHEIVPMPGAAAALPRNLHGYGKSRVNDDSKPFPVTVSIIEADM